MSKAKKRLLYTIYFICTTVIFLYYLFPSEAARQFLMVRLNQINPDIDVVFEQVKPAFPPGIGFSEVSVFHKRVPVFEAETAKITLGILPLFVLRPTVKFKCDAYDGHLKGKVGVSAFDFEKVSGDVRLENVDIADIEALHMLLPRYDLAGLLSGDIEGATKKDDGTYLKSDLRLAGGGIEFSTPLYGLNDLTFEEIETDFEMNGTLLKIDRLVTKGNDLNGSITGTVTVKQPIGRSKLSIKGEVTPGPDIISKLGELEPMISVFLRNRSGKKGFPINQNGTLDNPGFFNLPGRR